MTARWLGIIDAYRSRLPVSERTPIVSLLEGNTPLIDAPRLSEIVNANVMLARRDNGTRSILSKGALGYFCSR